MILDTTDIMIVRENELGRYDTTRHTAIYSCRYPDGSQYIRTTDSGELWIKGPKERMLVFKEQK
jgi:hypothetical protein